MPLYEYECESCGHRFEKIQKFSDPIVSTCPECEGKVNKLMSSPAIQFKGTGWYITDYARKPSGGEPAGSDDGASAKKDTGETSGASDSSDSSSSKDGSSSSSSSSSSSTTQSKTETKSSSPPSSK